MKKEIGAIWDLTKETPRVWGTIINYLSDIRKRWHAVRSTLPYDVALFFEYSFSSQLQCVGKTGNVLLSRERREKIWKETGITPSRDTRLFAESINADLNASFNLLSVLGKHKGLGSEFQRDYRLKKEYFNKSGFIIGGPVPNDTSKFFLEKIKQDTGLTFDFDLKKRGGHYPLITPIETYEPVYDENRETYDIDYGIVLRIPNLRRPSNTVILLMGCKGYGTLATSKLFTNPELLDENILLKINKKFQDKSFYLVIEAHIEKATGHIERINPIALKPLRELDETWRL